MKQTSSVVVSDKLEGDVTTADMDDDVLLGADDVIWNDNTGVPHDLTMDMK